MRMDNAHGNTALHCNLGVEEPHAVHGVNIDRIWTHGICQFSKSLGSIAEPLKLSRFITRENRITIDSQLSKLIVK